MILVRPELPDDVDQIRTLLRTTFSTPAEADLVDAMRKNGSLIHSWVAVDGSEVVGFALFTTARADFGPVGLALGPMAVSPSRQGAGLGTELLRESLDSLAQAGEPWVVVLGHPRYYPRFGFRPASVHGLVCPWDVVPDPAFLVRELRSGGLEGVTGKVRYRPEFDGFL